MPPSNASVYRCGVVLVGQASTQDLEDCASIAVEALVAAGHQVSRERWVSNDLSDIRYSLRELVDGSAFDVVLGIGGTGIEADDVAPEALAPLVSKPMPGFGELFRRLAFHEFGIAALQSRAQAAVCCSTLVYLVPSDPAAVKLALRHIIVPQLGSVSSPALLRSIQPALLPSAAE
ncbi:MAG TPA: molybdopterin-binding protein [Polyangiaceae bacterium]|nr:molybdopterin-binding protein [Polyangiaceae bacterium]